MKLRNILRVLSYLAVISVSTAGYVYYASLEKFVIRRAEQQAVDRLENVRKNLSAYLSANIRPVRVMAGMNEIKSLLSDPTRSRVDAANSILDHFRYTLEVEVCYVMDAGGNTIVSSNRYDPDSFVGQNFSFRPYFQEAMQGLPSNYLALGTTSGRRGAYSSFPIYLNHMDKPAGVAVIKASIFLVENELGPANGEIILVTDPNGVIFISNHGDWHYQLLWDAPPSAIHNISASRQFGQGPWNWIGFNRKSNLYAADKAGTEYMIHEKGIDNYPGWRIVHLHSTAAISKNLSDPVIRITLPIILAFCFLVGISVFFLYQKATAEILQRKSVQKALQQSENRYRSLYHHTPAMLHSIDPEGCLLSVSDYWVEHLGYDRAEVIGKPLTDFYTPESREYAQNVVFKEFFRTGFCKDIQYRIIRKNGDIIDVLLSAIADRDEAGNIVRSLAVSMDVTERNKAVAALKQAKEALSRHSEELERQVRKRTREITGILEYTPAMVYMKDKAGRYLLINSRFEQMFGLVNETVRGKADRDILPPDVADQFTQGDQKVLAEGKSCQVEEHIQHSDGLHIYLSVKFPIFDGVSRVSGVCGIATDITAVKKAQDQLRRLSGAIMDNQEKERAYIARELHDELGQVLTALRLESVWLRERLEKTDDIAAGRAGTMCDLIDESIEEVRSMAIRLRPGVLDHLGLVDALEGFTADFEKRSEISCIFEVGRIPELQDTVATAAYRITQEALTNVARHAHAGRVEVQLNYENEKLTLVVKDDGCGFDPMDLDDSQGLGVLGMRERAALINGRLAVESRKGKGTMVNLQVALTDKSA
ncbi:MAG: PAS domain S-box protein [Desulfobacteraceae bacterium]|nr:PAS domain S-box protein [Desulfobacteraceae bacterium]